MLRTIALLILAAACATPVVAAQVREETTYFTIRGSTLEELDLELATRGPLLGTSGARHPGATRVTFGGNVTYDAVQGRCRVDEVNLSLDVEMTLPRWNPPRNADEETILIWRTLSRDIERHERDHADIARHWLRRLEGALRNLRPRQTCEAMERSVQATTERYLRWHERAQTDFDIVEGREVNYRLRRLLREEAAKEE